jgi:hypothetical protein
LVVFFVTVNVGLLSIVLGLRLVVLLQLNINNKKFKATKKESVKVIVNSISDIGFD